jgi:predicted ATPase
MLDELHLSSFKCFDSLDLPLAHLTVLSGVNGGGKSSVIQSIVLLAQTLEEREWSRSLLLNGPNLALGGASDVINQATGRKQLSLGVSAVGQKVLWTFVAQDRRALSLDLTSVQIDEHGVDLSGQIRWLLPVNMAEDCAVVAGLRRVSWLSAERTGPRELLPLLDSQHHAQVGVRGELAAGLLYWRESDSVAKDLRLKDEPATLFHQVRAWMRHFFPGCDLQVLPIEGASAISLRLRSDSRSDFQRPQNVGFGLTQLFPVLVAVLAARPGDIVIVENPEVHLHPRAQQEIGTLLARVANSGVQVILETHSDHILNGVRLAAKGNRFITADCVAIHFFTRAGTDSSFQLASPKIDADGRMDSWPEGFFDQFDQALSILL